MIDKRTYVNKSFTTYLKEVCQSGIENGTISRLVIKTDTNHIYDFILTKSFKRNKIIFSRN